MPVVGAEVFTGDLAGSGLLDCYAAFNGDGACARSPLMNGYRGHSKLAGQFGLAPNGMTGFFNGIDGHALIIRRGLIACQ